MTGESHELRRDPLTGRWVILAANREKRPNQFVRRPATSTTSNVSPPPVLGEARSDCPFCADQMVTPPIVQRYVVQRYVVQQNVARDTLADAEAPWDVCVVPNLYPVLTADSHTNGGTIPRITDSTPSVEEFDFFVGHPPWGFHEVVIESPTHLCRMKDLPTANLVLLLHAFRDRMLAMRDWGVACVLPIKNSGPTAGATLEHVHSQIFGLPFVPPTLHEELDGSRAYFSRHQRCVICDEISVEEGNEERIVLSDDAFVAWCPFASRSSYEICIAPRNHNSSFESIGEGDLRRLGGVLRTLVQQLDRLPTSPAFNLILHSLPFAIDRQDCYHWHIEIIPRLAMLAGFEWGSGLYVNSISPENAATQLRV